MKLGTKISFGVTAVQAGQKAATVNAAPQLVVNSTLGKFSITSTVSKALNIAVGDNVMFLNNIAGVDMAIQNRVDAVVEYANEHGIDLDTREGVDAVLAAFTQWFIAKGVLMYKSNGEPIYASERFTKEDKAKYLAEHAMEMVEANREALVERFGDLPNEELAARLTPEDVVAPKYHAMSGSRTSTSSSSVGVGCKLNFTDAAVWHALKADLGENKEKKNRIFDVALDELQKVEFSNGKENVVVDIVPINFVEDVNPVVRVKKDAE